MDGGLTVHENRETPKLQGCIYAGSWAEPQEVSLTDFCINSSTHFTIDACDSKSPEKAQK